MTEKLINPKDYMIVSTKEFKLKDKVGRQHQIINLKNVFGIAPDIIAVEKIRGQNNKMIVRAFIPKKDAKKESKIPKVVLGKKK